MSDATPKSAVHKAAVYREQNGGRRLTAAQARQIRKTEVRANKAGA